MFTSGCKVCHVDSMPSMINSLVDCSVTPSKSVALAPGSNDYVGATKDHPLHKLLPPAPPNPVIICGLNPETSSDASYASDQPAQQERGVCVKADYQVRKISP